MNRPGRPKIDQTDESVSVSLTLPAREYDRVFAEAQRERVSIAEVLRRRLLKSDHQDRDD